MTELKRILKKIRKIKDPLKRNLIFIGALTKAVGEKKVKPVVVGGFALEFYSTGGYATGDIDIIYHDSDKIGKILIECGFEKKGRYWVSQSDNLFIEIPGDFLKPEEYDKITVAEIEGYKVNLISVEDLIVDRLNAFVHWKSTDDGYWLKELLFIYSDKIDNDYLKKRCIEGKTDKALIKMMRQIRKLRNEKS